MPMADEGVGDSRRTAVVVIHGMGEQRPLETLRRFIGTALPSIDGRRMYFSRPDKVSDSFEARRFLAPAQEGIYGQSEFFEYHWSYMMKGNKLADLLPTVRRILLQLPTNVPPGLRVVWFALWAILAWALATISGTWAGGGLPSFAWKSITNVLFGGAAWLVVAVAGLLGTILTKSFVDVIRYLDTSPRSYEARRDIRAGIVELLQGLHDSGRYSRVVVVAHSLGAFIAYDAITYLWAQMNKLHGGPVDAVPPEPLEDLAALEAIVTAGVPDIDAYQNAQWKLWLAHRRQRNPWLITDFISVGTPMYMADQLFTRSRTEFDRRVDSREMAVTPPRNDGEFVEVADAAANFGWYNRGREVLYYGAPFAVTRWTNLWFPPILSFFGDIFGGPLRPLFGNGIRDVQVLGNRPGRFLPGFAHARYFLYPDSLGEQDVATLLRAALQLNVDDELAGLPTKPAVAEETR